MTRGRAATPDPFDISAVNSTDEIFDALSSRRLDDLAAGRTEDPAAALLAALVTDVDTGAPPLPAPARVSCGTQDTRRRGVRAFVTFSVAALFLTSAGVAAAGGQGHPRAMGTVRAPVRSTAPERSNENSQRYTHPLATSVADRRMRAAPHLGVKARRGVAASPESEPAGAVQDHHDRQRAHRTHRPSIKYPRTSGRFVPAPVPPDPSPPPRPQPKPAPESPPPAQTQAKSEPPVSSAASEAVWSNG